MWKQPVSVARVAKNSFGSTGVIQFNSINGQIKQLDWLKYQFTRSLVRPADSVQVFV